MNNNVISSLKKMIDVNTPIIYIHDYDFVRVDELISSAISVKSIFEWNPATGTTDFFTKLPKGSGQSQMLEDFLSDKYIEDSSKEKFIVLKEVHELINETKIKTLLLLMSQRKLYDRSYDTTIIIVSSILNIPQEIEKYVSYLEIDFPDEQEIERLINEHIEINFYDKTKFKDSDKEKLMLSLKGMTAFEIDRILDLAMSCNGSLGAEDAEMILRQKKQLVKKSGLLELIDTPENINSIGGMNALKEYIKREADIMKRISEAQRFGVSTPKGIFIVGMPGCGKSLCAKASASIFEAPLLKLDMGNLMGKYVGESEAKLRKAIQIAEAASPCILWIDEIDKGFSGIGGNNDIITRMFGHFLSWMQDKKSSVYVIATANNAESLPPELKRKGRFDEIFCVNLPDNKEREDIFKVHLERRGCIKESINYQQLANSTNGFNGADIESVVNESIKDIFLKNKKTLTTSKLIEIAQKTISISKSSKTQIDNMNKSFSINCFKDANTGETTKSI